MKLMKNKLSLYVTALTLVLPGIASATSGHGKSNVKESALSIYRTPSFKDIAQTKGKIGEILKSSAKNGDEAKLEAYLKQFFDEVVFEAWGEGGDGLGPYDSGRTYCPKAAGEVFNGDIEEAKKKMNKKGSGCFELIRRSKGINVDWDKKQTSYLIKSLENPNPLKNEDKPVFTTVWYESKD